MTSLKPYYCLIFIALLLSACTPQPTKPEVTPPQSLSAIPEHWNINAKLGIRNSEQSGSVTLKWQQQINDYHIRISGPLGQGSGLLTGNQHNIRITQGNKAPLYSDDPTSLIKTTFGWDLPLDHLPYWVRGLASPLLSSGQQSYTPLPPELADTSQARTLATLTQSGWHIEYSRFKRVDQWLMPHRIRAKKQDVVLTLIVKQWTFPKPLRQ